METMLSTPAEVDTTRVVMTRGHLWQRGSAFDPPTTLEADHEYTLPSAVAMSLVRSGLALLYEVYHAVRAQQSATRGDSLTKPDRRIRMLVNARIHQGSHAPDLQACVGRTYRVRASIADSLIAQRVAAAVEGD
jgi:hypothetical protein